MRKLELLAPARSLDVARQAILYGADAVYMGAASHGARAAAGNSIGDIREAAALAHAYGARLYVTVNTLVYDSELDEVAQLIRQCYSAGADALIVQDMGLLRMSLPPIALHASTQCDIRTPEKAAFLADAGFGQLVLPREFSLDDIRRVREAVPADAELEAFVHGALCVSYSGDCQASCLANGRSANRGECAQICRMSYDLVDDRGRVLMRDKHLLSLRDMCRIDNLEAMARAGISSFKIEGRLKDAAYVKNVVLAYRQALDKVIDTHPDEFCHASLGRVRTELKADVASAFNRGFTPYFLGGRAAAGVSMASIDTPKWIGRQVGKVVMSQPRMLRAHLTEPLHNGDGLGYFDADGRFVGFRLNRIEGSALFPATAVDVPRGTVLYRNRDTQRDAEIERAATVRTIGVEMTLSLCEGRTPTLALTLAAEGGHCVTAVAECATEAAKSDQKEPRAKTLGKLGGTRYHAASIDDKVGADVFVQASVLAALRRRAVEMLDHEIIATHRYRYRRAEGAMECPEKTLTYHNNVANRLARRFYADHGATEMAPAAEIAAPEGAEPVVMTTRYCLRRELNACLRTPAGKKLEGKLYLRNKANTYRLEFDCANCRMRVHHVR